MVKSIKTTRQQKHTSHPGPHHTKQYKKVYWPYLPVFILIVSISGFLSMHRLIPSSSQGAVLSYATDVSEPSLLAETNKQRMGQKLSELVLHPLLSKAAQAKANDMASKDYWSHISPDGISPWVFIDAVTYSYKKAGENLAYGFNSSTATIVGWMNSPPHRANLLDIEYTDVGFGIANIPNYQLEGEQTLVVAMYGAPSTASGSDNPSSDAQTLSQHSTADPITSDTHVRTLEQIKPRSIARIQLLTGGTAPWSLVALLVMTGTIGAVWLARHAVRIKRVLYDGERFVLSHPLLDVLVLLLILALYLLSRNAGTIL